MGEALFMGKKYIVFLFSCRSESEHIETAIQTDLPSQRMSASRSLGPTTLLKDSVIRREDDRGKKESPKTAMLLALSRPSRPISRSQSQVTVAGEARQQWTNMRRIKWF